MNKNSIIIEFKWPWTMIPLECADDWIKHLREKLNKNHPLFGKNLFPSARREDENTVLFENDDDGTYAIISFGKTMTKNRKKILYTEIITSPLELDKRIERDHKNG